MKSCVLKRDALASISNFAGRRFTQGSYHCREISKDLGRFIETCPTEFYFPSPAVNSATIPSGRLKKYYNPPLPSREIEGRDSPCDLYGADEPFSLIATAVRIRGIKRSRYAERRISNSGRIQASRLRRTIDADDPAAISLSRNSRISRFIGRGSQVKGCPSPLSYGGLLANDQSSRGDSG